MADDLDALTQAVALRDINGNKCGSVSMVDAEQPQRLRGHTLLIGGDWVTLWPVEILGAGTFPPDNCSEPIVWLRHSEDDWSAPCQIERHAVANRWGWAYSTHTVEQLHIEKEFRFIRLSARDREALMVCGSENADRIRGKVTK